MVKQSPDWLMDILHRNSHCIPISGRGPETPAVWQWFFNQRNLVTVLGYYEYII